MDPNTLSVEEGKTILKQIGIPQRDIDVMTEKWMVVVSVEVMLRFPLKPGENLEACSITRKMSQTSMDQPRIPSPRDGELKERKHISQYKKKTWDKDMRKIADHHKQQQTFRSSKAQTLKLAQCGPVSESSPSSQTADTRFKGKRIGAFDHKMSCKMCLMKHCDGALCLRALGSNREKENLKPSNPQEPHGQGSVLRIIKEKKQTQKKSSHQNWEKVKQKTKDLRKIVVQQTQQQSFNSPNAHNLMMGQTGPVKKCAPSSEREDPTVKCKNCGAFGHKMSSKLCPMKCWDGALALQHLGSNKKKEILKPSNLQEPHNRYSVSSIADEKKPSQRNTSNHYLKTTDQRTKAFRKIVDHHTQQQTFKYLMAQNRKMPQSGSVRQCAPRSEVEDTRVKCRNCGAFGHKMSSKMCPMKRWDGALALQPLGSNKEKEILKPSNLQEPHIRDSVSSIAKEKEPSQRQEEQTINSLTENVPSRLQKNQNINYEDVTESCHYLRSPTRPMPVYQPTKTSVSLSVLTSGPPVQSSAMRSVCITKSLVNRPEQSSFLSPKTCEVAFLTCLDPSKNVLLNNKTTNKKSQHFSSDLSQFLHGTQSLGSTFHSQPQSTCPDVGSKSRPKPITPCTGQKSKVSLQAPGKRLSELPVQNSENPPKKPRLE